MSRDHFRIASIAGTDMTIDRRLGNLEEIVFGEVRA